MLCCLLRRLTVYMVKIVGIEVEKLVHKCLDTVHLADLLSKVRFMFGPMLCYKKYDSREGGRLLAKLEKKLDISCKKGRSLCNDEKIRRSDKVYPFYEVTEREVWVMEKESVHVGPHLHRAMEFVYVTEGTLELGVEKELYHMEEGDFGIVFPEMIHHYQVFAKKSMGCYVIAKPQVYGVWGEELFQFCPEVPVIAREEVPEEIVDALMCLKRTKDEEVAVRQAYVQILLGKSLSCLKMVEKKRPKDQDLVYEAVVYLAAHFRERVTLAQMAKELGVSSYILSRMFSGTFHKSFPQYLNDLRLSYACELLEYTDHSITEICMKAGFESQRTFNRVFREAYHLTPREYRRSRRMGHLTK